MGLCQGIRTNRIAGPRGFGGRGAGGVKGEEEAEPYSVKEQTHKELEELQTQQPAEVQMNTCIKFVIFSLLGWSCA